MPRHDDAVRPLTGWRGWELGRLVVAFAGVMYLGMWAQLSLMHRAGAFKHPLMYLPVFVTPFVVAGAAAGTAARDGAWGVVALVLFAAGVAGGLLGSVMHVRGIRSQIGGFSMRNLLSGPPPILPVAYSLVGVLGLLGLLWDG